jgi:hypothetical protein
MIVVGKGVRQTPIGFGVDYCPVCRGPMTVRVFERCRVTTVWFIPVKASRPFELLGECPGCKTKLGRQVGYFRDTVRQPAPWDEIMHTAPFGFSKRLDERARVELAVIESEASVDERLGLIAEVIAALEYDAVLTQTTGSSESLLAVATVLALGLIATAAVGWHGGHAWKWAVSLPGALLLGWVFWMTIRGQVRYRARLVEDRIARAIAPFDPTADELKHVIRHLSGQKYSVAKGLNAERVASRARACLVPPHAD